jgi:hypothetical protein
MKNDFILFSNELYGIKLVSIYTTCGRGLVCQTCQTWPHSLSMLMLVHFQIDIAALSSVHICIYILDENTHIVACGALGLGLEVHLYPV